MRNRIRARLADRMIGAYVDWREASIMVHDTSDLSGRLAE